MIVLFAYMYVTFSRRKTVDDWGLEGEKVVKRALFGVMNNYPQKKIMTFNKFSDDFNFAVNLNNLDHLEKSELANIKGECDLFGGKPNIILCSI